MKMLYFDWIISVNYFWTVHLTTGDYTSFKRFPAGTIPVAYIFPCNFYIFLARFISLKIDSRCSLLSTWPGFLYIQLFIKIDVTFKATLIVFGKWDCPLYIVIYFIDVSFKAALIVFGKWDCPLYTCTVIYYIDVTFKAALIAFGKWDCPLYTVIYYIDVTFKAALIVHVFGKWDCPLYTVIYFIDVSFKAALIVFGKWDCPLYTCSYLLYRCDH